GRLRREHRGRRHDRNSGRRAGHRPFSAPSRFPVDRHQRPDPVHAGHRPFRRTGVLALRSAAPGGADAARPHHGERREGRHPGLGMRRDGRRPQADPPVPRHGPAHLLDAPVADPQGQEPGLEGRCQRDCPQRPPHAAPRRAGQAARGAGKAQRLLSAVTTGAAWFVLFIAGLCEVGWAVGLKYTEGFSRLWPSVATLVAMAASVVLLAWSLKVLPLGTAYAVWTGIGAVGTAILGIFLFGESREVARLLSIGLIVAGIVGLKLLTPDGH